MRQHFLFILFLAYSLTGLAQVPRLVLPEGHTDGVTTINYSPDSRYLLTASNGFEDRTVRMWEIKSGKLIYALKGHFVPVSDANFSPNGKYILTHAYFNHLWDANTGELVSMVDSIVSEATCFSADSRYLIMTRIAKDQIQFWDIANRKKDRIIECEGMVYDLLEVTKDGRYLVGYAKGGGEGNGKSGFTIWDIASGNKVLSRHCLFSKEVAIKTSPLSKKVFIATQQERFLVDLPSKTVLDTNYTSFEPDVKRCYFSDDDQYLYLAESEYLYQLTTYDFRYKYRMGKNPANITAITVVPGKKELIALDSKAYFTVYNIGDTLRNSGFYETQYGRTSNLKISPDGKTFTISTFNQYTIIINYPGFTLSSYLTGEAASMQEVSATVKKDKIALTSITGEVRIADGKTGKVLNYFYDTAGRIEDIVVSPGGEWLLGKINSNFSLNGWDAATGKKLFTIADTSFRLYNYVYSPAGKTFASWEAFKRSLDIRDAATGKLLAENKMPEKGRYGNAMVYTKDGKYLFFTNNCHIEIRDGVTGKLVRTLTGPLIPNHAIKYIDLSSDETKICAATDSLILAWDIASGRKTIQQYWNDDAAKSDEESFLNIHFNPSGDKIIAPVQNGQTVVLDYAKDSVAFLLTNHYPETLGDAAYSPNGKYFVTIGEKLGYLISHDAVTGEALARFGEQSEAVTSYTFAEDGNSILIVSENSLHRYNLQTGKRLYRTLFINQNDWLTIDDAGRFDGTEAARKLLYFTCGKEIIELEQVKDKLWVPNLAERINRGDSLTASTIKDLNICGLTPLVQSKEGQADLYQFQITARKGGLGDIILQVNGIEARRYRPAELKRTDSLYELVVNKKELEPYFASGYNNKVTVRALTQNNDITSRSLIVDEDSAKVSSAPPRLFAVIVGVSDYKGDDLDLKYAAKDAVDIGAAISAASKKLLNTDTSNRVFVYNFNSTEKAGLLPEKANIKKAFEEIGRKASANDILLIFFAGHGVMEGERKQFYFLTADASKTSATADVASVGISTTELADWMKPENIKAQKRVLIFDACNSGQAIKDFVRLGSSGQGYLAARNDDKEQIIKAIDKLNEKSGLFILSASASNQSAYEMGRYTQGLLTHALLKVMKEQRDVLEDEKFLNLSRWLNAAEKTVTQLSKESGARQEPQIVSNTNFNIGVVDAEVRGKIILPKEKPVFTFSNFQNSSEAVADDDLEFSKLLNQQLNDISSRNTGGNLIYVISTNEADAYSLTGRYTVKAGTITVKANIKKGNKIIHRFEISKPLTNLGELAAAVIQKATEKIQ